ncbi:MAG: hypothetical protein K8F30_11865, partial [Taibaiella sp.]|nr:hypothetical protein [Taibaiella sp.]
MIRIDENGNPKWQQGYNFNSTWIDGVGDITELPNGNIAVCGTNYFGSVGKDVGILVMLDSAGTRIFGKSYGGALMLRTDVNSFHSITATDSNILIVGRQHRTNTVDGGLLVVADFNGNVINTYLLDKTPYASGPDSLYKPQFSDIMVKGGKIYVNGTISLYRNSVTRDRAWQLFGTIDTNTRTFSGHTVHVGKDDYVTNPEFFVTDSGKYLISLSSKEYELASPRNRYFLCGISGDSVEYVVKIANDSLATVKALNLVNDTAIATGGINASDKRGYFFYYKGNSVNIKSCSIADSVINLDTIVRQVKDPYEGSYMPVTNWPMNRLFHDTLDYGYISERQVCGDTICSPVFEAMLDTLTATTVCYGDSVIFFERTKYPKAWIRDNTTL